MKTSPVLMSKLCRVFSQAAKIFGLVLLCLLVQAVPAVYAQEEDRPVGVPLKKPPEPAPTPPPAPTPKPTPPPTPTPTPRPTPPPEEDRPVGLPRKQPPPPTPTPDPTPPPGPSAEELRRAADEGRRAGADDGRREGEATGVPDGEARGRREGRERGFRYCRDEERRRADERGYQEGLVYGARIGAEEGERNGRAAGERDGASDGEQAGLSAAQKDARDSETPGGTARGEQDAASRAQATTAQATRDGTEAGDKDAATEARRTDYERGRTTYRTQRFAEVPRSNETFSLVGAAATKPISRLQFPADDNLLWLYMPAASATSFSDTTTAHAVARPQEQDPPDDPTPEKSSPSYSNRRSAPGFDSEEERRAYERAYRQAYDEAWRESYRRAYRQGYRYTYRRFYNEGCDDARRYDYQDAYRDGERRGTEEGRRREYDARFAPARETAYRVAYRRVYADTYDAELPAARTRSFNEARQAARERRTQEIYDAAFARAREKKYAATYPTYQTQEYSRGQADELADFAARPVRLTAVQVVESVTDGVYEPDEELRLTLGLRNFANENLRREDFTIIARADDGGTPQEVSIKLEKELRPASSNTVQDALAFYLPESALSGNYQLKLELRYKGQAIGEETVSVPARYAAEMALDTATPLAEGLPRIWRVTVTNRSTQPTPAGARITWRVADDAALLEAQPETPLGTLAAGASQTFEIPVTARAYTNQIQVPLDIRVEAGPRRLGRLVATRNVTVTNDYRVNVSTPPEELRRAGNVRVAYQITNRNSSERTGRALQVTLRVLGDNAASFVFTGPLAQYLAPLKQGQTVSFVAPLSIKQNNNGGILEITVQEEGRPVIVRQLKF